MLLWQIARGDAPLIVSVPHAGRHVPDAIALRLSPPARRVPDTDWHVDKLYRFVAATGATLIAATHSRYVVDLNRDPSGTALYPGADNTELCPTRTFADARGGDIILYEDAYGNVAIAISGFDPLRVTLISVALTVVIMPLVVLPFLVLVNEEEYVGTQTSGPLGNALLATLTVLGALMAIVVIPLEIFGG